MTRQTDIKNFADLEKFIKANPDAMCITTSNGPFDWDRIFEHLHANLDKKFVINCWVDCWYLLPWETAIDHSIKTDYDGVKGTWTEIWKKYAIAAPIESLFDVQIPIIPGLKLVWAESITNTLQSILSAMFKNREKVPSPTIEKLHQYFMLNKAFKTLMNNMGAPIDITKK